MVLDLRSIQAKEGAELPFGYDLDLSGYDVFGENYYRAPVRVSGRVKNHTGIFRLELSVEAAVETGCARCGQPIRRRQLAEGSAFLVREIEDEESEGLLLIEGDSFDPDGFASDLLILSADISYLCREDCKGLCPVCGADLNGGECGCDRRVTDSRFDILRQLLDE